ncbi:potassium channel family protein [Butyricicoccus intestinisimiae]|jgi:trk system potassium uptake protein TrkA|uniref:potassium channel family protein n=1 Tax=Butyricicoccus intestinisimiae TaxID=2841509 RepID=UPI003D92FE47
MKSFVVIGLGRFGTAVAEELYALGHEVLAIDREEGCAQRVSEIVTHTIIADAKDESVLQSIGVRNFDGVIICMTDIEDSVMIALMLKDMGAKYIIAKSQSKQHSRMLELIGVDRVVFPEQDMGVRLAQTISSRRALDFIELSPEYAIVELPLPSVWQNKTLAEIGARKQFGINVLAIRRGEKEIHVSPQAEFLLKHRDVLIIVGKNQNIRKLEKLP